MPDSYQPDRNSFVTAEQHDLRAPTAFNIGRGTAAGGLRTLAFVALDSLSISLAWWLAVILVERVQWLQSVPSFSLSRFLLPILLITQTMLAAAGLYSERESRRNMTRLFKNITLTQATIVAVAFLYEPGLFISRSVFLLAWILNLLLISTGRWIAESAITTLRRRGAVTRPIFLIGTPRDRLISQIALKLASNQEFKIVGQADLSEASERQRWTQTLHEIADKGVGEVFVCSWQSIEDPMALYWSLKMAGIHLRILPTGLEIPHQAPKIETIGSLLTIQFQPPTLVGGDFWTKRLFDIVVASTILLVGSPIYLFLALLIKLDSPGPIFYKQTRVGLKGRHFKVWKFRTMVINADRLLKELEARNEIKGGVLFKMKDDPRITKVGKFLRRYSLDELPQAINVLIGDMSLVGPRPLPLRDVEGFAPHHHVRHNVMPGITGLWQVSGRSDITDFEDAFRLDMTYIQNWSLASDFKILLRTVQVVFASKGAY
ncbi:sugar transferase [Oscillatoria sp. FACHB-1406]|uniref:sugar transferase n=1 Tax=Oscillatoria sp. FACHB-1406 TaxID=2692846 RepID=UPI0016844121|nr:sugar transferase [Oscillatoria sp. FACHB-1406]MBD2580510.1 sugar transferase [Oscillatoria sp. FACHB-1406]